MTLQTTTFRVAIIGVLFLLSLGIAAPQHGGLQVPVESYRPSATATATAIEAYVPSATTVDAATATADTTLKASSTLVNPLQSIMEDTSGEWALGKTEKELSRMNIEWEAGNGLSVRSNLSQNRITSAGSAFNTAVQSVSEQALTMSPFARTKLSFSQSTVETLDLGSAFLGGTQTQVASFGQSYGRGSYAGSMNFNRKVTQNLAVDPDDPFGDYRSSSTVTEQVASMNQGFSLLGTPGAMGFSRTQNTTSRPGEMDLTQITDMMQMNAQLWAQTNFSGSMSRTQSNRVDALQSQTRQFSLARQFAAGTVSYAYNNTSQQQNMVDTTTQSHSLKTPFRFKGHVISAAFDKSTTEQAGKEIADTTAVSFATKMAGDRDLATSWSRSLTNQSTETLIRSLKLPLSMQGVPLNLAWDSNVVTAGETRIAETDNRAASFSMKRADNRDLSASWARNLLFKDGVRTENTVQALAMPFRLRGTPLVVNFNSNTTQQNTKIISDVRAINVTTRFQGQDISGNWNRTTSIDNGNVINVAKAGFGLPVNFFGEKLLFNYNLDSTQVNDVVSNKATVANFAVPLSRLRKGMALTYNITGVEKTNEAKRDIHTATLAMPLRISGRDVTTETQRQIINTDAGDTTQWYTKFSTPVSLWRRQIATSTQYIDISRPDKTRQYQYINSMVLPFKSGPVSIARHATTEVTADGRDFYTRVTNISGPRVAFGSIASVQGDLSVTELPGLVPTQRAHANVQSQLSRALGINADFISEDHGSYRNVSTHQLDANFALSEHLRLSGRYLTKEQPNTNPIIQRTLVFQKNNTSASDLRFRAAFTSTDNGTALDTDIMRIIEAGVGDASLLGITAQYQEYDEGNLTALATPLVRLGFQHGVDASSVNWGFFYEDYAGRPEPQRKFTAGVPFAGARIKVAYTENPIDPRDANKQAVWLGELYDATLTRRLFDQLDLNVGYKKYEYVSGVRAEDQYWQFSVTGGSTEGIGALQFGYANGEFVPTNTVKAEYTPVSTLSLRYEKKWVNDGNLSLNLSRVNMPSAYADLKDTYEGRMQFELRF